MTELTPSELIVYLFDIEKHMDSIVESGMIAAYEIEKVYKDGAGDIQASIHVTPVASARNITINIFE